MTKGVKEACIALEEAMLHSIWVDLPWPGVHDYFFPTLSPCPKMTELEGRSSSKAYRLQVKLLHAGINQLIIESELGSLTRSIYPVVSGRNNFVRFSGQRRSIFVDRIHEHARIFHNDGTKHE